MKTKVSQRDTRSIREHPQTIRLEYKIIRKIFLLDKSSKQLRFRVS